LYPAPGFAAVQQGRAGAALGFVGLQDELDVEFFFLLEAAIGEVVHKKLPLVFAQVEHLKGAEIAPAGLQLALYPNEPLAGSVDAETPQVGGDPLAAQFFGCGCGGARATEEIGNEVAGVAAGADDAFE
jgi:hypothetical protein